MIVLPTWTKVKFAIDGSNENQKASATTTTTSHHKYEDRLKSLVIQNRVKSQENVPQDRLIVCTPDVPHPESVCVHGNFISPRFHDEINRWPYILYQLRFPIHFTSTTRKKRRLL